MKAYEHTDKMLAWWGAIGVTRVDLAIRQPSGAMLWHRDIATDSLPLEWARAQNVHRAEVYARPARHYAWPVVFLDDVATPKARAVANKYDALVIETSPAGGCHIWLACTRAIIEASRRKAQRWLAERIGADLGSISGEHLGRLAGFKNWKRGGTWVNVVANSLSDKSWAPCAVPAISPTEPHTSPTRKHRPKTTDTSPSGREWALACYLLENGCDPEHVYFRLIESACFRRGCDTPRYARRTLVRAMQRVNFESIRRARPRKTARSNPEEVKSLRD